MAGNVFIDQPEFISTDPRRNRPDGKGIGYKVTPDFMLLRHESLLPGNLLKGKKVLDLGSCTGASGAWCLSQGAAFYMGVELNDDFVRQSCACLAKYYDQSKWRIEQRSVEDFLETTDERFDVILASGILYGSADPMNLLKQMSEKAERIVIESVHQHVYLRMLPQPIVNIILKDPQSIFCLENASYITVGQQGMIGTGEQTLIFNGLNPSMGALKFLFQSLGFVYNDSVNLTLKKKLPDTYHPLYRFGMLFEKDKHGKAVSFGFAQAVEHPDNIVKKVNWEHL
jgi:16S rRNA G966 N2-methylase RsmD